MPGCFVFITPLRGSKLFMSIYKVKEIKIKKKGKKNVRDDDSKLIMTNKKKMLMRNKKLWVLSCDNCILGYVWLSS